MEKISIDWQENMSFQAHADGFNFFMDAAPGQGGQSGGIRPKLLMLVALAGCTGMDVAALTKKMRVEVSDLSIDVEGDKSDTSPPVFTAFRVLYRFKAHEEAREKIIKMVEGSQQKYCSVSKMMRQIAPVTYEIWLNDEKILG